MQMNELLEGERVLKEESEFWIMPHIYNKQQIPKHRTSTTKQTQLHWCTHDNDTNTTPDDNHDNFSQQQNLQEVNNKNVNKTFLYKKKKRKKEVIFI